MGHVTLLLAFHNHQPQGNFGEVFEQAYADCYRPLIEALVDFPAIKVALHHTGPLLEWIEGNRPDYLRTLRMLVERGQVEVLGGGFYEPMLAVLPERDAVGQLEMMNDWCESRLGTRPRGMWLAERVWEPDLPRIIARAGLRFTMLDDTHFRNAGVRGPLNGYYVTEKAGAAVGIFPIDKELRYAIPFMEADKAVAMLEGWADGATSDLGFTYGDDGEKFGVWPGTKDWVWGKGWLRRFLALLSERKDKIGTGFFDEYMTGHAPTGRLYLPTASYEEMGEWSLPADAQVALSDVRASIEKAGLKDSAAPYLRGGIWQNFLGKYDEANRMHKKMLWVSARLADAQDVAKTDGAREQLASARRELYRGQCNCAYWHGLFGGLYLGGLRHAVYKHLIEAEVAIDQALGQPAGYAVEVVDMDADFQPEVLVTGHPLNAYFKPGLGAALVELDFRPRRWNVLNVLGRRPEGYHEKLRHHAAGDHGAHEGGGPKSIHDIVKVKEPGLERLLVYDRSPRVAFVDHFLDPRATLADVHGGRHQELGDFAGAPYETAGIEGGADTRTASVSARFVRRGQVAGRALRVEKVFRLEGARLECRYTMTLEDGAPLEVVFAPELNLFLDTAEERARAPREVAPTERLDLQHDWLAAQLSLGASPPAAFWQFPIETASQSEGGFERTYQGTTLLARFPLRLEAGKPQTLHLSLSCIER